MPPNLRRLTALEQRGKYCTPEISWQPLGHEDDGAFDPDHDVVFVLNEPVQQSAATSLHTRDGQGPQTIPYKLLPDDL